MANFSHFFSKLIITGKIDKNVLTEMVTDAFKAVLS